MDEIKNVQDPNDYQHMLVDMMIQYEKMMGELYRIYAQAYPEYKDFWEEIACEEDEHASWLAMFLNRDDAYFSKERFGIIPVEYCIKEVQEKIQEAKENPPKIILALGNSMNIENGMIENKFFEVYEGDSEEFKRILANLKIATKEHLKKVVEKHKIEEERTDIK